MIRSPMRSTDRRSWAKQNQHVVDFSWLLLLAPLGFDPAFIREPGSDPPEQSPIQLARRLTKREANLKQRTQQQRNDWVLRMQTRLFAMKRWISAR